MSELNHILFITPDDTPGGAETSLQKTIGFFKEKNRITTIYFDQRYSTENSGSLQLDTKLHSSKKLKGWNWFRRYRKLRRFKKDNKVDVSISFLEGADYLNVLSRTKSEKVILSVRGSKLDDREISGVPGFIRKTILIPWLYKKADLIITVSHGTKDEMIEMGMLPEKIIVIPNGFDFQEIDSLASMELPTNFSFLKSRSAPFERWQVASPEESSRLVESL